MDGEEAAVSCLTIFELARFARKGSIEAEAEKRLREAILGLCRLCWLDREDVLLAAANLSNGIGLHAMDALILAGFLSAKATTIYSTDSDFEKCIGRRVFASSVFKPSEGPSINRETFRVGWRGRPGRLVDARVTIVSCTTLSASGKPYPRTIKAVSRPFFIPRPAGGEGRVRGTGVWLADDSLSPGRRRF